jgi:hypothetical protein
MLAVACSAANRPAANRPVTPGLTVAAGELSVRTPDGRVLHGADLVGSTLQTPSYVFRIDATQREAEPTGDLTLYRVALVRAGAPDSALCAKDASGEEWALPYLDEDGHVSFACTSGAIGKCIRWGYPPGAAAGLHQACVRMVRADYGGDGTSHTRDGTLIGFCDRVGIHPCNRSRDIEAAWSAGGAVCVAYPRIPELVTLDELARTYPQLQGRLGTGCTLASETADGRAVLYDWRARPE